MLRTGMSPSCGPPSAHFCRRNFCHASPATLPDFIQNQHLFAEEYAHSYLNTPNLLLPLFSHFLVNRYACWLSLLSAYRVGVPCVAGEIPN